MLCTFNELTDYNFCVKIRLSFKLSSKVGDIQMSSFSKYPRTLHLPWSLGLSNGDKALRNTSHFSGRVVVVTEKLDGENTTLYTNHTHARSMDSVDHVSRHWLKRFHAQVGYNIPDLWRVCGENVYAKHSIHYLSLTSYFYLFSIWNDRNVCLSWEDTVALSREWGIPSVPVLYFGIYDEKAIKSCFTGESIFGAQQEGYVIRLADSFSFEDFDRSVAKFVRKDHVQTSLNWMHQEVVPNKMISVEI